MQNSQSDTPGSEAEKAPALSAFLDALDEWGCEDNDERAKAILQFIDGGCDLSGYASDTAGLPEPIIRPMDTYPKTGPEHLVSTAWVHEGCMIVLHGSNDKPIGWIDTHEWLKGRVYRDRLTAGLPSDIPSEVYYSAENVNFYNGKNRGMGQSFFDRWACHCKEFPQSRETIADLGRAPEAEPVAWEWRQYHSGKWWDWNPCWDSQSRSDRSDYWRDLAAKMPNEMQVRALFATPPAPQTIGSDEAVERAHYAEGVAIANIARADAADAREKQVRAALERLLSLCEAGGDPFEEPNRVVVAQARSALANNPEQG